MKIVNYQYPHSSFLSVEKDMGIIVNNILKNENLKKLLHYTSKDCLERPKLTQDESLALFGKNIKTVPKLYDDNSVLNYIVVNFDKFITNPTNPEFRNNIVEFDIVCHFNQWQLKDFQLRPYRIAAELDTVFNKKHLSGIGTLEFLGASQEVWNDEFAGLCLIYLAIHSEDDKKFAPNPISDKQNVDNFNEMFNQDDE